MAIKSIYTKIDKKMKIKFVLTETDYLEFQIFAWSKSEVTKKKRKNSWVLLTIVPLLFAIYFQTKDNNVLSIYFITLALICALFYPKYFRWNYKRHFKNYINTNYSDRFGETTELEFSSDHIYSKENAGEGKILFSEIEQLCETATHLYVMITNGMSLIIPKKQIDNIDEIKEIFKTKNIPLNQQIED